MHLSAQFPELFRREVYAVKMALHENKQFKNVIGDLLPHKPIVGSWDKEYEMVPFGALEGRKEGEPIPQKGISMGYTCYGAICNEASVKVGLSKELKGRAREFSSGTGKVDEEGFAGYIGDAIAKPYFVRWAQRQRLLCSRIFNYGGIQAGHAFFNHRARCNLSDVPASNVIYDNSPLFARPAAAHTAFASGAQKGSDAQAVGNFIDYAKSIADTGGYFNAFDLPPSYWALKRVWTHFVYNMQFDENDERFEVYPDTLLVSSYNYPLWCEILKSKFIEPNAADTMTNTENVFQMVDFEGSKLRLVPCVDMIRNTWFLGKANSPGIILFDPQKIDDEASYWRDENDRSYWASFEDDWGFMIRNWRYWCAGAISTDGSTAPTFDSTDEIDWHVMPDGI